MSETSKQPEGSAQREAGLTEVTEEMIAQRAYELSQSDESGTPEENWARAERELRERLGQQPGE